jgi:3-phosphoshikimate 1-carboxyvinyltransferase
MGFVSWTVPGKRAMSADRWGLEQLEIPYGRTLRGKLRPPGSKSITNRALVLGALAEGTSRLQGVLESEDTAVMKEAWRTLGVSLADVEPGVVEVEGTRGRIPRDTASLYVANSGTTMRFLCAVLCLGRGPYRLYGVPRMHERPMGDLVQVLNALGARVRAESPGECPPIVVEQGGLRGGSVTVPGTISSQFTSGLLMAAPYVASSLEVLVTGPVVSAPFIQMTVSMLRQFGVDVDAEWFYPPERAGQVPAESVVARFFVRHGAYRGRTYPIEPDATAASYFFAAAALTGGEVTVEGLGRGSIQGDLAFLQLLEQMGARVEMGPDWTRVQGNRLVGITADLRATSDLTPTLAILAAFAEGPTHITGIDHIRHQETDRIQALAGELGKLGALVEERTGGLTIQPRPLKGALVETYNDHRLAMSFAVAGLRVPGLKIKNPGCVAKTYPQFFDDFFRLLQ